MSRVSKRAIGLSALTALVGGTAAGLVTAPPALAAYPSSPPASALTADPNSSNGTLTFYDATGHVVTSGNNLAHLFDYARASTNGRSGATKATVYFAFPDHTQADSQNWNQQQVTASTGYPNSSYPGALGTATQPIAKATASDANLSALLASSTEDTTAGYQGYLQIRLFDSGQSAPLQATPWWATIIEYDKTAGTWQQVSPSFPTTQVSTISATPTSPAPSGTTSVSLSATLTASDGSHPTGDVELFNGATDLGPATFNAATGAITKSATVADNGSYNFKFVYSPTSLAGSSSSPVLAYSVKGPSQGTSTVVTGPTTATYGTAVTYHADVKTTSGGAALPAGSGTVQFKVDGANSGSAVALTASGADFTFNPPQPPAGGTVSNVITAAFTPSDPTAYNASADNTGVTVVTSAPAYTPDPQTFTTTVPQGTLVISTPYTAANPFDLGTMVLNGNGTAYTASKPFGDSSAATTDPGNGASASKTNGVTITDTRAASTGWTAYAQTSDFTNSSGSIDGNGLTFTGVKAKYLPGNNLSGTDVSTFDITANMKTAKQPFASTAKGPGTVAIYGNMNLTAPTSTKAGVYTATVTFTIM